MSIRKLDANDICEYTNHLTRVYDSKGLMSTTDSEWVEERRAASLENILSLLVDPYVTIWGEFNHENRIIKSLRSEMGVHQPVARLINFKSESNTPFNPVRSLLPMLDIALRHYEQLEIYSFFLLRRLDFFSNRRNVFWEDNPPLDRYNSYYDEIIEPDAESKHTIFRALAGKITYPMKTAVVQMCLKQEYRTFGPAAEIYEPVTAAMAKINSDKERMVCVIGSTTGKVGDTLCNAFSKTGSTAVAITRNDVDFNSESWQSDLQPKIPTTSSQLVIVLNLYDHSPGRGRLQEEIFDWLWGQYKLQSNVQIVVVGSMAHYYELSGISEEYTSSKRNLRNKVVGTGRLAVYNCKLLFLEPGVIDTYLTCNSPQWNATYFTSQEFADRVIVEVDTNNKFTYVTMMGSHSYKSDKYIN